PKTRAIIVVHLYGRVADMPRLAAIAREHNLKLIEDACQAHGAVQDGKRAGTIGDVGCLSFYPTKNVGTVGEGGMVLTSNDAIAERVASLRNHGQRERHHHVEPGYNYRMPELQAAALRALIPHLEEWNGGRVRAAGWYREGLAGTSVAVPAAGPAGEHVYHLYVVRSTRRDELQRFLGERGIGTAIHYPVPIHLQPAYASERHGPGSLPRTEEAVDDILSLPMHPNITREEVGAVCAAIREFDATKG
ncbi:MAG: DegT/DnrJ/EryC1/StrS family aminotransferase, partial [Hyphomicrobiales bacterium]